jgi:hypothetical protein
MTALVKTYLTLSILIILHRLVHLSIWIKPFIIFGKISKYVLTEADGMEVPAHQGLH